MRRLALALLAAAAPVAAFAASLNVPLNEAVMVTLPAPARDLVLGNPNVADAQMSDQRHVVVTGKVGGVTNLIVTGLGGRIIYDRQVVVGASSENRVSLIEGRHVSSYACAPLCERDGDNSQQAPLSAATGGAPFSVSFSFGGAGGAGGSGGNGSAGGPVP